MGPSRASSPDICTMPMGPVHRFRRHAPLGHAAQKLIDERRALRVLADGFGQRLRERQADEHDFRLQLTPIIHSFAPSFSDRAGVR